MKRILIIVLAALASCQAAFADHDDWKIEDSEFRRRMLESDMFKYHGWDPSWRPEQLVSTVIPGYTFTNGETNITYLKLNLLGSGTVTNISTGDILDEAITASKLAADSVTSAKILANTILGGASGDIATNTVSTHNILIGTLSGREVGSTFTWPENTTVVGTNSGVTFSFSSNAIASSAVAGTNASPGAAAAGLVPKLNSVGVLSKSILGIETGGSLLSANTASTTNYSTLVSVTPTATNGTIYITCTAQFRNATASDPGPVGIDLHNGTTQLKAVAGDDVGGDLNCMSFHMTYRGTINGSTTYSLRGICGSTAATAVWSGGSSSAPGDADIKLIDATGIEYFVIPP